MTDSLSMPTKHSGIACKTCRRRGRKCTRELPACQSCLDKGLECEGYPLKWAGLASRGYLAGKQNRNIDTRNSNRHTRASHSSEQRPKRVIPPASQARSLPEPAEGRESLFNDILNLSEWTPSDFQVAASLCQDDALENEENTVVSLQDSSDNHEENALNLDMQVALMPRPAPDMNLFNIPSDLKFILNYHVHEVAAKLCVDNNALQNPYREYIYPMALQRPALLYACAAMSSVHYSTRQQNDVFFVEALRLRGKALSRLQESLWSSDGALDESNLATILMLILCDMCMGGHSNFEMYFTFAKSLIDLRGPNRTWNNFVEQYISWLDIMSCASTSRKPVFSLRDVTSVKEARTDWSHDVVPCAAGLFEILLEIVNLSKNDGLDATEVTAQLELLKIRVLSSPIRTERGMPWYHLTEAYRYGILLYMILLFDIDSDEDEVMWLVSSIIQHAKSTPSYSGWSDQLLWPLFHAGLKISDTRRQDWLRSRFLEMQLSGGFRNVSSAQAALEKVWTGGFSGSYFALLVEEGIGDMLVV